jgi:hypothetical protein
MLNIHKENKPFKDVFRLDSFAFKKATDEGNVIILQTDLHFVVDKVQISSLFVLLLTLE